MDHSLATSSDKKGFEVRGWRLVIVLLLAISGFLGILCRPEATAFGLSVWPLRLAAEHFSLDLPSSDPTVKEDIGKVSMPERRNNGLTTAVEWDDISLFIFGQRVFIWSGEFHPWRLPVPSLWRDILEKMKAAGLNTVSIYVHWGLVNPSPGVFDFEGYRDLKGFFELALEVGLWVILRPGPYINAETTAGGLPHWVISSTSGHLRTNSTEYAQKWKPYIHAVCQIAKPYQVSLGGPIIAVQVENEYLEDERSGYVGNADMMLDIENEMRAKGIVVPLTFNDAEAGINFASGKGAADIYGLDSYPQRFDCSHPETWRPIVENYYDYHMNTNPRQPWFTPEFQGGAFDAWGPNAPGYDACAELTGAEFESVFYRGLLASNFKLINLYMIYGGTSWGYLPFPGVYTSYDYGAAIAESRLLRRGKMAELKRQAFFVRSTPEIYNTVVVGNSSESSDVVHFYGGQKVNAFGTLLKNLDTGAQFYILRHLTSNATTNDLFKLTITTSLGQFLVPQTGASISLNGRESKIVTTDLTFGVISKLLYSTAQVLWAGRLGDRDALVLHGASEQLHEAAIEFSARHHLMAPLHPSIQISGVPDLEASLVTIQPGVIGLVTIWDSAEQIILYADTETAGTLWFPGIPTSENDSFANYWRMGMDTSLLVGGPYLVRGIDYVGGDSTILNLRGDLIENVRLILVGLTSSVRQLRWNGQPIEADIAPAVAQAAQGILSQRSSIIDATLTHRRNNVVGVQENGVNPFDPPKLLHWKYADSLPEIMTNFSDANWVLANRTATNSPFKPYGSPNNVNLYGCDYGFCEGITLYRGHFNGTGSEQAVRLSLVGGAGFAAGIWINGVFLGTSYGNCTNNANVIAERNETFIFPLSSVIEGDNVLTVIIDNMGFDESQGWGPEKFDSAKSARGIRNYELIGGKFSSWRVQGKLGGFTGYPDKFRGLLNEGGSYAERNGWHIPGFDTSSWRPRPLSQGLPNNGAGLGFFVTKFELNIPVGFDIPMSLVFDNVDQPYRAILFVNGWMMGKRIANLGPQFKFPVHEGILNYRGVNTVAVLLWALENVTVNPSLEVIYEAVIDGGIGNTAGVEDALDAVTFP